MESALILVGTAYALHVGFLTIVNQKRGFAQANRFWLKTTQWIIRGTRYLVRDLFDAIGRSRWLK